MLAYAKINLGLYVIARRPDGFHDIETVFCRIGIADDITLASSADIRVTSSSPEAPAGESNICHKAARLLATHLGVTGGVHIHIEKQIPAGAGLGGGSADAALVIKTVPAFWNRALEPAQQFRIALELGSDVPFFLNDGAAIGRGRGEELEYFPLTIPFTILVCNPNIHIPTAWAYGRITPGASEKPADLRKIVLEGMRTPALLRELHNDFEPVAFEAHPEIRHLKETMLARGAVFALMSGSGSTVFGFFERENIAAGLQREFAARGYRAFVTPAHFHAGAAAS